jgi:rhodanese-related sulfurtransferase
MFKLGIVMALIILGIFSFPIAAREYSAWDARNPEDDDSSINRFLNSINASSTPTEVRESISLRTSVLIDVRSKLEFDEGHIDGAILIPEAELYSLIKDQVVDKNTLIFLYSNDDMNAGVAARLLSSMGYDRARYMRGGIESWKSKGFSINSLYAFPD